MDEMLETTQYSEIVDNYCCIDLETTGFSSTKDKIIEIGVLKIRNGEIVDSYDQLINPAVAIPWYIKDLTAISNEMVINSPTIDMVLFDVKNFIGNDILIGHNIKNFDIRFLSENFEQFCSCSIQNDILDLLSMARICLPWCKDYKLQTLMNYLEIDSNNNHRALADAESTYLCYEKIKKLIAENKVPYYNENYRPCVPKPKKQFDNYLKKKVCFKEIASTTTFIKRDIDFYKKTFVFTGDLKNFTREEACKIVLEGGGFVKAGVSKAIDYLVNANNIISSKELKARELIEKGCKIEIINEEEFLEMIYNGI